ncbi:hypothetical protein DPMN_095941 [Dreissena polymorpha]|uniref:Uncharacterized protein n=1 Tax=Dreissena polymorpha TaxID=45954 RepID=A0A9D4L7T8_DREPO|nr:hypothetical protein DPMN_095941 [Dreissena polymorpha]
MGSADQVYREQFMPLLSLSTTTWTTLGFQSTEKTLSKRRGPFTTNVDFQILLEQWMGP